MTQKSVKSLNKTIYRGRRQQVGRRVHSFVNKSAVSSVSPDFKCNKHMGRLSLSVCDRQTDRHATASVHQTATSSTANRAESQDIQMLHCVSARRSLLSQCHLSAAHRNMQPSLWSFSRNSQCSNLLFQFSRTPYNKHGNNYIYPLRQFSWNS